MLTITLPTLIALIVVAAVIVAAVIVAVYIHAARHAPSVHPARRGALGVLELESELNAEGLRRDIGYRIEHATADGGRVDLTLLLPDHRMIPVEVKNPDPANHDPKSLARWVRGEVKNTAGKRYWDQPGAPPWVLLHLPDPAVWLACIQADPNLMRDAADCGVRLTTVGQVATTALVTNHLWRDQDGQERIEELRAVGRCALAAWEPAVENHRLLGGHLSRAVTAYNARTADLSPTSTFGAAMREITQFAGRAPAEVDMPAPIAPDLRPTGPAQPAALRPQPRPVLAPLRRPPGSSTEASRPAS